jgi:hypothetical protein
MGLEVGAPALTRRHVWYVRSAASPSSWALTGWLAPKRTKNDRIATPARRRRRATAAHSASQDTSGTPGSRSVKPGSRSVKRKRRGSAVASAGHSEKGAAGRAELSAVRARSCGRRRGGCRGLVPQRERAAEDARAQRARHLRAFHA